MKPGSMQFVHSKWYTTKHLFRIMTITYAKLPSKHHLKNENVFLLLLLLFFSGFFVQNARHFHLPNSTVKLVFGVIVGFFTLSVVWRVWATHYTFYPIRKYMCMAMIMPSLVWFVSFYVELEFRVGEFRATENFGMHFALCGLFIVLDYFGGCTTFPYDIAKFSRFCKLKSSTPTQIVCLLFSIFHQIVHVRKSISRATNIESGDKKNVIV